MKDSSNQPSSPQSMEEEVHVMLRNARTGIREQHQSCEERIRNSPTCAMLGAVAAGYMLHRLPVRAIIVTKLRVIAALAPPALFLFGVAKIHDFLQKRDVAKRK